MQLSWRGSWLALLLGELCIYLLVFYLLYFSAEGAIQGQASRLVLPQERSAKLALVNSFHELGFLLGPLVLIGLTHARFAFFAMIIDAHNIVGFYLVALWLVGLILITSLVSGEDEARVELQSGEWDSLLAFDSLNSQSFDQSYKLSRKTNDWTRPSSVVSVLPQIGEFVQ